MWDICYRALWCRTTEGRWPRKMLRVTKRYRLLPMREAATINTEESVLQGTQPYKAYRTEGQAAGSPSRTDSES